MEDDHQLPKSAETSTNNARQYRLVPTHHVSKPVFGLSSIIFTVPVELKKTTKVSKSVELQFTNKGYRLLFDRFFSLRPLFNSTWYCLKNWALTPRRAGLETGLPSSQLQRCDHVAGAAGRETENKH